LGDLYSHIINNFSDQYDILEQYAKNPDGSFWFASHINEKYLDERRPHTQREMEIFNAFYYGNVVPISDRKLDITKIKYFDNIDFSKPPLNNVTLHIVIDPATSKKQDSSNTAIVIGGMDSYGNLYLLDTVFGHWSPDEVEDRSLEEITRYYKYLKGVHPEEVAQQAFFVESLRKEMIRNNLRVALDPVKPRGQSKADRILKVSGLEKIINEGRFYCRRGLDDFLRECEFFPKNPTMDIVDAVAYLCMVSKPAPAQVVEPTDPLTLMWKRLDEQAMRKIRPQHSEVCDPVYGRLAIK